MVKLFFIFIGFSFCSSPLLLSLSYGLSPQQACASYMLQNEIATLGNVSSLYNILTPSSADAAYIKSWCGDSTGWVMTRSGKMIPYRLYTGPVYYVFCDQDPIVYTDSLLTKSAVNPLTVGDSGLGADSAEQNISNNKPLRGSEDLFFLTYVDC